MEFPSCLKVRRKLEYHCYNHAAKNALRTDYESLTIAVESSNLLCNKTITSPTPTNNTNKTEVYPHPGSIVL